MKDSHKIILLSIIIGVLLWIIDAIVNSYVFYSETLWDLLIFDIPAHDLYFRIFLVVSFILFGILTSRTMSRKKKLEEQILIAKNDWEDSFDTITDAITIHDKDFNITRANKAAEKILGMPFSEIINKRKCYELFHGKTTIPEGCPSCEVLKTEKPAVFEIFEPHLKTFLEIRAIPRFNIDNNVTGIIHVVRDITKRKESEEKLTAAIAKIEEEKAKSDAIISALGDGMIIQDTNYRILYQNEIQTRLYGRHDGEYCYKVYEGRDAICKACPVELTFKDGKIHKSEKSTPTDNGILHFELTSSPLRDSSGNIVAGIKVVRDITERKLIEQELDKHRQKLEELVEKRTSELKKINKLLEQEIIERDHAEAEAFRASHLASLGELAAGVAHEINNPVNGIINYAQIMANISIDGSREKDFANRIIKEANRITTIVQSLLSFARDRKNEGKSLVHLREILSESLILTEKQIRKDGIDLGIKIPEDIPKILVHPQQIEQVVLNIISNARYALNEKYQGMHKDKTLEITGEDIMIDGHRYVRIIFYDSGAGIPSSVMDKVMNPFFSTKPSNVGTGLGLSISHGIINAHDGKIKIDSVEGEFTRVMIDLPVKNNV